MVRAGEFEARSVFRHFPTPLAYSAPREVPKLHEDFSAQDGATCFYDPFVGCQGFHGIL